MGRLALPLLLMNLELIEKIEAETGSRILPSSKKSVSGGCIHQSAIFETEKGDSLFVKQNTADSLELFATEYQSLKWLASTETIRVPEPLGYGEKDGTAFLAMEALKISNQGDAARMGHHLARLHSVTGDRYGANFDNFIGATPQPNPKTESWADFFTQYRLEHMFRLAAERGHVFPGQEKLLSAVHHHLTEREIKPSLLHGDLWGGNAGFDENGEPVLFDPACYMGDAEADIAFTRVFGGFGPAFYETYRETFPEPEPIRESIYNLYHILNHCVLFGGGYGDQANAMIREILRAL